MKIKKITLKNGLRLLLVNLPESLTASVLILVQAGSEYETKKINGLSHFLEHLTFKGTKDRPKAGMISEELAALGARSNAFTGQEYTGYWAKVQAHKLPKIIEIVSDLYLNPLFDQAEMDKERGVIIQEINMDEDDLPTRVYRNFMNLVYGDQPAGWDIAGKKEIIAHVSRKELMKYRDERYVMPGTVVIVAGKMDERAVQNQIKKYFGALPRRAASPKKKVTERQSKPSVMVQFKKSDQAHVVLGFRAFSFFDKRRYALQVLSDVLGGGSSSRLFKKVREEMGAAYYIGSDADLSLDHGLLSIVMGVEHAKMQEVLRVVLAECTRLTRELVPDRELQKSKDHMIGSLILGLETSDELGSFYGSQEILRGTTLSPEVLMGRIKEITAEDVRSVAKDIIKEKGLNLAAIGPYKDKKIFEKILRL